jgi:hypothetical protein
VACAPTRRPVSVPDVSSSPLARFGGPFLNNWNALERFPTASVLRRSSVLGPCLSPGLTGWRDSGGAQDHFGQTPYPIAHRCLSLFLINTCQSNRTIILIAYTVSLFSLKTKGFFLFNYLSEFRFLPSSYSLFVPME